MLLGARQQQIPWGEREPLNKRLTNGTEAPFRSYSRSDFAISQSTVAKNLIFGRSLPSYRDK